MSACKSHAVVLRVYTNSNGNIEQAYRDLASDMEGLGLGRALGQGHQSRHTKLHHWGRDTLSLSLSLSPILILVPTPIRIPSVAPCHTHPTAIPILFATRTAPS